MSHFKVAAYPVNVRPDPLELFRRLNPRTGGFVLHSGEGPPDICRYSFLGGEPFREMSGSRIDILFKQLEQFRCEHRVDLPPFQGGAVGYFSYDLGRCFETLPELAIDDMGLPAFHFGFYDTIVSIDHYSGSVWLVQLDMQERREFLERKKESWLSRLCADSPADCQSDCRWDGPAAGNANIAANFTKAEYLKAVEKAIDYIYAGDIFQVNLAQRFSAPLEEAPFTLYNRLNRFNPAPFSAYLDLPGFQIISSSPERFISLTPMEGADMQRRRIETRPIKGTRPRGSTPEEDITCGQSLLASEKDAAELRMIVDLQRNDIGRVSRYGTVKVAEDRRLEQYPTVFHTVSVVAGEVRTDKSLSDILRATFPGGSITGAPKIRAMEIIEELEPVRRGVYTGSIGYIGFSGTADLNIAIRTMVAKQGKVYFHAGGGIVADSDPLMEYQETLVKAEALMRTLNAREVMS